MKLFCLLLATFLLALPPASPAQGLLQPLPVTPLAVDPLPAGSLERERQLHAVVSAPVRQWVAAEAGRQRAVPQPDAAAIAALAGAAFPHATGADIDALVFLVMMTVAHDAGQELREQAEAMQAINRQKRDRREYESRAREQEQALREQARAEYANAQPVATAPPIKGAATAGLAKGARPDAGTQDGPGDLGEQRSLRLQAQQERRQKAFAVLSGLMKKVSDTDEKISDNLK
jgi:hypothetical protein